MKWNYVVFLLLFEGFASHSLMVMERYDEVDQVRIVRDEVHEDEVDNREKKEFDITLSCCGFQDPILDRRRRETNIRSPRKQGLDVFFPRLNKRDIREHTCFTPRIVGGEESEAHSWPWMVAIFRVKDRNDRHLCGGSLISQRFVLSAAHCFGNNKYRNPSSFLIKVGSHSLAKDGIEYGIQDILKHPEYRKGYHYNDIALLKVKGRVKLSDKIYPICLPSNAQYEGNKNGINTMTVTGWGTVEHKGQASEVLLEVKVPEVSLESCQDSYSRIAFRGISKGITSDFICAGFQEGGKDACQGDSGGPLIKYADGRWFQFGIVSFGYGCARPGFPGVYTRVSKFVRWLYENSDLKMDLLF